MEGFCFTETSACAQMYPFSLELGLYNCRLLTIPIVFHLTVLFDFVLLFLFWEVVGPMTCVHSFREAWVIFFKFRWYPGDTINIFPPVLTEFRRWWSLILTRWQYTAIYTLFFSIIRNITPHLFPAWEAEVIWW